MRIFDTDQEAILFFRVVLSFVCSVRDPHLVKRRAITSHLWNKQRVSAEEYNLQFAQTRNENPQAWARQFLSLLKVVRQHFMRTAVKRLNLTPLVLRFLSP